MTTPLHGAVDYFPYLPYTDGPFRVGHQDYSLRTKYLIGNVEIKREHQEKKMKNAITFFVLFILGTVLTGCETTSSIPYPTSTENVLEFQNVLSPDLKVKLGSFVESQDIGGLTCRWLGGIDVSRGKTRAEYIRDAMQSELFLAQAYSVDSDIVIEGRLDSLDFSSMSGVWEFGFTVFSNKSAGYTVQTNYPFKTSFSAYGACNNVADAFGPAVQDLINTIVTHRQFAALVGK